MFCYSSNLTLGITSCKPPTVDAFRQQGRNLSLRIAQEIDKSVYRLNPLDRRVLTISEHNKIRCFETTLAICSACDLTPDQAIKEACKKNPPPIYFEWWRSPWDGFKVASEKVTVWVTAANQMGLVAGGAR